MKPRRVWRVMRLGSAAMVLCGLAWATVVSAEGADDAGAVDAEASIDDLLGIPGDGESEAMDKPGDKPADEAVEPEGDTAVELSDDLERRLDGAAAADVFDKAREGMGDVAVRLSRELDGGKATVREQDLIIARLDQVIRSARKQQQQSSSSSSDPSQGESGEGQAKPKPTEQPGQQAGDQQQPGEESGQQQGEQQQPAVAEAVTGGQAQGEGSEDGQPTQGRVIADGSAVSMKDLREGEWGNLPPRLRHELTESITEAFSPVYRRHTEAFYRRIAESLRQSESAAE